MTAYVVAALGTLGGLVRPPSDPEVLLPLTVLYALLSWRVVRGADRWSWGLLALLALLATALASYFGAQALGFIFVVFATALLAGRTWSERDRILAQALRESRVMQRRRNALAAAAVRAERLRIARDLHVVTSHAVGVMVLQAGAAHALAEKDSDAAFAALRQVCAAGEDALVEIAQLIDVVDQSGSTAPDLRQSLIEVGDRMRTAGLNVELRLAESVDGDGDAPTDRHPSQETIHRVVQEGLTNVLRHAPGARVLVEVERDGSEWLVRVADDGSAEANPVPLTSGGGYGLVGLAERVEADGGSFLAGPRPTGGFLVEARLPGS